MQDSDNEQPIHGFDEEGEPVPVSPNPSSPRRRSSSDGDADNPFAKLTRSEQSSKIRKRTYSLSTLHEGQVLDTDDLDVGSLDWDGYLSDSIVFSDTININSSFVYKNISERNSETESTSTQFSVPIDNSRVLSSSSSDEFDDAQDEVLVVIQQPLNISEDIPEKSGGSKRIQNLKPSRPLVRHKHVTKEKWVVSPKVLRYRTVPRVQTAPTRSRTSLSDEELDENPAAPLVIMASPEVKVYRATLSRILMIYEDDFEGLNLDEVTIKYVEDKLQIAETLKTDSQAAMLALIVEDLVYYEANLKDNVTAVKRNLIEFIRKGQKYLRDQVQPNLQARDRAVDPVREAVRQIKIDRVNTYEAKTVGDLNAATDEFRALHLTEPGNDVEYRTLEENLGTLTKRSESIQREARLLCTDAVETGLAAQSQGLEFAIRTLKENQIETETRVHEHKARFGILSSANTNKYIDVKPPVFSGDPADKIDFFTFKREFEEYLTSKPLSKFEQLKVLLRTCLQGSAKNACSTMTDMATVWSHLEETYGNPRILFANKIEDIRKLGSCVGSNLKKREWSLAIRSKLVHLRDLAENHNILDELYFSPVVQEIEDSLTSKMREKYRDQLKEKDDGANATRKDMFEALLDYMDSVIHDLTCEINYDLTRNKVGEVETNKAPSKPSYKKTFNNSKIKPTKNSNSRNSVHAQATNSSPQERNCDLCKGRHTHLVYCEDFQKCDISVRYKLAGKCKVCFRCLRMDSDVNFNDKAAWWETHKTNCRTTWECKQAKCATRPMNRQYHMLLCSWHVNENVNLEQDFIKSLNQSQLKPGTKFFFQAPYTFNMNPVEVMAAMPTRKGDYDIIPDVNEPSIFMLQEIAVEKDRLMLLFYDSGCMGASISNRAVSMMETENVRCGPTMMSVAGAETILIKGGDERFWLVLSDQKSKTKATLTGLHMEEITCPFPLWNLQQAWSDVQAGYLLDYPDGPPLPLVNKEIGGVPVDVMIGIRYNRYFPELIYSLPSGLGIYKSKFASPNGNLGVLGGPHQAWRYSEDAAHILGPRSYLTAEARAYYAQGLVLRRNLDVLSAENPEILKNENELKPVPDSCVFLHCDKHSHDEGWMVPLTWSLEGTRYNIRTEEYRSSEIENLGTEITYRCIRCRNCNDCRKGEILEKVSLQEELEQAMIESSVILHPDERKLESKLPFILDPAVSLKPNRYIAERILESQLRLVTKNPEMKDDVIKSHNKLRLKGHVIPYVELPEKEKELTTAFPGPDYHIPWRTVYKEGSLSTPCRMVFDASSRTPGGESLNNILAKGSNKLASILHILLRFRQKPAAMTADVSMAYNGVKLDPSYLKFQKYLWKEDLDSSNPTIVMVVRTLIYGVRPAGNLTMAGFSKLSDYCREHFPEHELGAKVLSQDAYMDDLLHSGENLDICRKTAESLDFTLNLGSMGVKAYTFSSSKPSEVVSADGVHVGLVGLLWNSEKDIIGLDVKDLYFGKPKRGKLPEFVRGNITEALKTQFTRRTLVGKVAGVFDPLGLVTPISAKFKLNLHELNIYELDWDDQVPEKLLDRWVRNIESIQELKSIRFRRTIIPPGAVSTEVDLIVSVDASENIAISAVHSRVLCRDGSYKCQLICAKSKIVSTATIPRAELKACVVGSVLAHTVKSNLGEQFKSAIYVTDSTVALYWINQDQRPLQVAVRNSVIEIRRFTQPSQWFHIESENNIADLGTRPAETSEINEGSDWQVGKPWMRLERRDMPIRTSEEVTLSSEEKRLASKELRAPDISGIVLSNLRTMVGERYSFSKYIVDPCAMSWPKSVRILAYVYRFISRKVSSWIKVLNRTKPSGIDDVSQVGNPESERDTEPDRRALDISPETSGAKYNLEPELRTYQVSPQEIDLAERYFFRKATLEVKQFYKAKDWKDCSVYKNGILYYSGRILEGQEINDVEQTMWDLQPLSFTKPLIDRYSPVAYSIMGFSHAGITRHKNSVTTLRESRSLAFVLRGRDLANEIRDACVSCRRFKAKLIDVEMGKIHETRLTIAPPFYHVQVDLLGPYSATCEHNHRSSVKVWGVVFKDPATAAIAVFVMQGYDTGSFLQSYTRFSSRYGHPSKLYIDEGSQLLKACKNMELNITDITYTLNSQYQVGIDFSSCPVGGHNVHGIVERSIKEVKTLFNLIYTGLKLDIVSYETAFAWISNEMNCLPICLGSKTSNLDHTDLITPSRLLLGRNNRRAMTGYARIQGPGRLMDQMERVYRSWWEAWKNEKLLDYIPQPSKWLKSNGNVQVGDVVIFLKTDKDQTLGDPLWKMGRIQELETSSDGLARVAIIRYKNSGEAVFRTTRRSVRKLAVLHREGDLELVEELNIASKSVNTAFMMEIHDQIVLR